MANRTSAGISVEFYRQILLKLKCPIGGNHFELLRFASRSQCIFTEIMIGILNSTWLPFKRGVRRISVKGHLCVESHSGNYCSLKLYLNSSSARNSPISVSFRCIQFVYCHFSKLHRLMNCFADRYF